MKRLILLAAGVLAAVLLLGCGGESDGTFDEDGFPFTFEYPDDWTESDDAEVSKSLGAEAEETLGVGLDDDNGIIVQRYTLAIEITEQNFDQAKAEFDGLLTELAPDIEGTPGEIGGYLSLTYEDVPVDESGDLVSTLVALFDGDQEYLINCQSDEDHRDEVSEGCDLAVDSLEPK